MPISIFAPIIREGLRQATRYIYKGLKTQDKIIEFTYRKTGLYNRGVVTGVKHGLIAGQIIGGTAQLGLNAPDTPGNDNVVLPEKTRRKSPPRYANKTRGRRPSRDYCRNPSRYKYYNRSRKS